MGFHGHRRVSIKSMKDFLYFNSPGSISEIYSTKNMKKKNYFRIPLVLLKILKRDIHKTNIFLNILNNLIYMRKVGKLMEKRSHQNILKYL